MLASYLVLHGLPYRSDTMCWESKTKNNPWLNEHFKHKDLNYFTKHNFQVQCKKCEKYFKYVQLFNIKEHIFKNHLNHANYEEKRLYQSSWVYFRQTKNANTQCVICDIKLDGIPKDDKLDKHISAHSEQVVFYVKQDWCWKYIEADKDKYFSGKCVLCDEKFNLCASFYNLKHHLQNIHEIELSPRKNMWSWESYKKKHKFLEKFFEETSEDFLVQCNICYEYYPCVKMTVLKEHLKVTHENIYDYEKYMIKEECKPYWCCIRFTNDAGKIKCMICEESLSDAYSLKDTPHEKHSTEQLNPYILRYKKYNYWTLKYFTQHEKFAKCVICEEEIDLWREIRHLRTHAMRQHKKTFDEMEQQHEEQEIPYDLSVPSTSHAS